jgi:hypothetical protein
MFHVRFAAITAQASIMEFMRVMDVRDFLSVQYVAIVNMYVNQNQTDSAWLTRPIAISVAHAD